MKKTTFFKIFSIALILVTLFISCADDSVKIGEGTSYLGAGVQGSAKSMSTAYDGFDEDNYYWYFMTSTTDAECGKTAFTTWTTWSDNASPFSNVEGKGLEGKIPYRYRGNGTVWTLELQARNDGGAVVYQGKSDEFIVNDTYDESLDVYVPLMYMNDTGNGTLKLNYGGIAMIPEYSAKDAKLTWTTEANLYLYGESEPVDVSLGKTSDSDGAWATWTDLEPASYVASVKYDSYGVLYEVEDTVNVHSNITATVTGEFDKRLAKTLKVHYFDGMVVNSNKSTESDACAYSGENAAVLETDAYSVYKFEGEIVLPTSETCIREGYTFIGWYTTDTSFTDDNRTETSASDSYKYVRTSGSNQSIFVDYTTSGNADLDFVLAYTTMTEADLANGNWFYEINLYARWIPNTIMIGADTSSRTDVILDYTSCSDIKGYNGFANVTINYKQKEIQGFTTYLNQVLYANDDDEWVVADVNGLEADTTATNLGATQKFIIDGFYDKENEIVITNSGILAAYVKGKTNSTLINKDGWTMNGGRTTLYAHWKKVSF